MESKVLNEKCPNETQVAEEGDWKTQGTGLTKTGEHKNPTKQKKDMNHKQTRYDKKQNQTQIQTKTVVPGVKQQIKNKKQ